MVGFDGLQVDHHGRQRLSFGGSFFFNRVSANPVLKK
jgi:hypothetical protein